MKKLIVLIMALSLYGCGMWEYSSKDNEMIGQVKKVINNTPMVCSDYQSADISLGILRGGVGSMSTQDKWVTVVKSEHFNILKQANESGELVKIKYDERRVTFCIHNPIVTSVEIIK
jgi:hypothetical protein